MLIIVDNGGISKPPESLNLYKKEIKITKVGGTGLRIPLTRYDIYTYSRARMGEGLLSDNTHKREEIIILLFRLSYPFSS